MAAKTARARACTKDALNHQNTRKFYFGQLVLIQNPTGCKMGSSHAVAPVAEPPCPAWGSAASWRCAEGKVRMLLGVQRVAEAGHWV